jgi:hypothetical protein
VLHLIYKESFGIIRRVLCQSTSDCRMYDNISSGMYSTQANKLIKELAFWHMVVFSTNTSITCTAEGNLHFGIYNNSLFMPSMAFCTLKNYTNTLHFRGIDQVKIYTCTFAFTFDTQQPQIRKLDLRYLWPLQVWPWCFNLPQVFGIPREEVLFAFRSERTRVARFFSAQYTKTEKTYAKLPINYQMTSKCTKWP